MKITEQVKQEIVRRGWAISKLSEETGIRYPSLTEWFNGNKELNTKNLQKIMDTLQLKIEKRKNGSRLPDYKRIKQSFDGKNIISCETEMDIPEVEAAFFLFGSLVRSAFKVLGKELDNQNLNYGNCYDKFVKKVAWVNPSGVNKMVIDIPQSIIKLDFTRIINQYLSEKEQTLSAMLLLYELPDGCDREYMETQFLAGLLSDI